MRPGHRGVRYCRGRLKRAFDLVAAGIALALVSPIAAIVVLALGIGCGPPILFRQERIGRDGRRFTILKFRTMHAGPERGLPITGRADARVTRLGRVLRATKLDEVPQLINVLRGEMSMVGPRPEVERYVARFTIQQRAVLAVRPGITDPASIAFRNEEDLLAGASDEEREDHYLREILPRKLRLNLAYIEHASLPYDAWILLRTVVAVAGFRGRSC
jgi:lipopolysaccharide/colanic/teichoic acid biosynthesis glycosyltransferase